MPLTREQLIEMATEKYFEGCNSHDPKSMVSVLSKDCVMWFNAAKYIYADRQAIFDHLQDFCNNFKIIRFHSYTHIVDVETQSIAVRFQIDIEDFDGNKSSMRNCNFFHANQDGLFREIVIFNSAPLQKGFEVGSST